MAAYHGYLEQRKEDRISSLQDARIIAYYAVAEHLEKGTRITDLFPIPGDDEQSQKQNLSWDDVDADRLARANEAFKRVFGE